MLLAMSKTIGVAIDVMIVALIVVSAFIGLRKGFFKSVISMVSGIVVIIVSFLLASPVAKLINKIYDFNGLLAGKLCKSIAGMNPFYSQVIPEGVSGADLVNQIPSGTNGFLKKLMSNVLKPLSAGDVQGATVADIVSGAFASIIVTVIVGILLFVLIKIVIAIATRLFDNITKNRVFGATNKLLGLAFGAAKGFIIVVIFAITLTLLTVIPTVNTKLTPILQDHTAIAKPIYNYTDEMVEKHVVDGKLIQKWVDSLWENKYKGRGDTLPEPEAPVPDGTIANPYVIELTETEGVYTATITIDFAAAQEVYYTLNLGEDLEGAFGLQVTTEAGYTVFDSTDTNTTIDDLATLDQGKTYLIKFTKGVGAEAETAITATPTTEPTT